MDRQMKEKVSQVRVSSEQRQTMGLSRMLVCKTSNIFPALWDLLSSSLRDA